MIAKTFILLAIAFSTILGAVVPESARAPPAYDIVYKYSDSAQPPVEDKNHFLFCDSSAGYVAANANVSITDFPSQGGATCRVVDADTSNQNWTSWGKTLAMGTSPATAAGARFPYTVLVHSNLDDARRVSSYRRVAGALDNLTSSGTTGYGAISPVTVFEVCEPAWTELRGRLHDALVAKAEAEDGVDYTGAEAKDFWNPTRATAAEGTSTGNYKFPKVTSMYSDANAVLASGNTAVFNQIRAVASQETSLPVAQKIGNRFFDNLICTKQNSVLVFYPSDGSKAHSFNGMPSDGSADTWTEEVAACEGTGFDNTTKHCSEYMQVRRNLTGLNRGVLLQLDYADVHVLSFMSHWLIMVLADTTETGLFSFYRMFNVDNTKAASAAEGLAWFLLVVMLFYAVLLVCYIPAIIYNIVAMRKVQAATANPYLVLVLFIILPFIPFHRFLTGAWKSGIVYFITFGFVGLWCIFDLWRLPVLVEDAGLRKDASSRATAAKSQRAQLLL